MMFRSVISELNSDREEAIKRMSDTIKLAEEQIKAFENKQKPKGRNDITKDNLHNHLLDAQIVRNLCFGYD